MARQTSPHTASHIGIGMRWHHEESIELKRLALLVNPDVRIHCQAKTKRYLITGTEGGGGVEDVGHYVGFVGVAPEGIAVSRPIPFPIPNKSRRQVFAVQLIRVQMFRYRQTCRLEVIHFFLMSHSVKAPPELKRNTLFSGRDGMLSLESTAPTFFDRAGEAIDLPSYLMSAIEAVNEATLGRNNERMCCAGVKNIELPRLWSNSAACGALKGTLNM